MFSLLLYVLTAVPAGSSGPVRDHVYLLEHNVTGGCDQLIWWDSYYVKGRPATHVREWRIFCPEMEWYPCEEGYAVSWIDNGVWRIVTARRFRETVTASDPERADLNQLPLEFRWPFRRRE